VESGRYDPTQTMDAIFSAVRKWRPLVVGIEAVAYQSALQHFIVKEMPERRTMFRVVPLKAEKKKELRIDALQPRFVARSVWFRARALWLEKLENELLAFPHGAHDDVIDALAYMEQIANAPVQGWGNSTRNRIAGKL
jgi:predicted phage terminase large subunit-like protein